MEKNYRNYEDYQNGYKSGIALGPQPTQIMSKKDIDESIKSDEKSIKHYKSK